MWKLIFVLVIVYLVLMYLRNNKYVDFFENLEYGKQPATQINKTVSLDQTYGPTTESGSNVADYRENTWASDPKVDVNTKTMSDEELRLRFKNLYSLDPEDSIGPFDLTKTRISTSCCPTQFAPPHKLSADESCLEKGQYVANPYSGSNMFDGAGCICMTQDQADFLGTRGGNSA